MNSVQKAIFPGIILASLVIIFLTRLISSPQQTVQASSEGPAPTEASAISNSDSAQSASGCSLGQRYPEEIRQWCDLIQAAGAQSGLDPNLIAAVMLMESGGHADAYSHSGAVGLMQVMPSDGIAASFMCQNGPCFAARPTISELSDPRFNISYGTNMLAGLLGKTGDLREALRLYGPMDTGYSYADRVLSIYENYQ